MAARRVGCAVLLAALAIAPALSGTQPAVSVDTSTLGPQVGTAAPALSGIDQFGATQTLASLSGPKGLMLVFNRSADW